MDRYVRRSSEDEGSAPTADVIAQWETARGIRLPDDFKQFMMRFNGGIVFPEYFPTNYPEDHDFYNEMDDVMQFDGVHSWEEFVEENSFISDWNPAEYVEIGTAVPGTMLMRIAEPALGSVHLWWRNNDAWDETPEPVITGNVAPSFRAFLLEVLHEVEGARGRWHHPKTFENAQKLEF